MILTRRWSGTIRGNSCAFCNSRTSVYPRRSLATMSNMNQRSLPFFAEGTVVKGFGRGSKELGIPTANFPFEVVEKLPNDISCGIYYGLASVNVGSVHKAVMSIGWNPYYQNEKKSIETHIMQNFEGDFYGSWLKIVVLGHIRDERDFISVDELIKEIRNDIQIADEKVIEKEVMKYKNHAFFMSKQC